MTGNKLVCQSLKLIPRDTKQASRFNTEAETYREQPDGERRRFNTSADTFRELRTEMRIWQSRLRRLAPVNANKT